MKQKNKKFTNNKLTPDKYNASKGKFDGKKKKKKGGKK